MQPLDYIKERLHFSYGTQMGLKLLSCSQHVAQQFFRSI